MEMVNGLQYLKCTAALATKFICQKHVINSNYTLVLINKAM